MLFNILRGTSLAGLAGIEARLLGPSVTLIRPLLTMRRAQVVQYLRAIGQEYLFDETNTQPEFSRNRIRNELLPLMREKFNRDADSALLRLSSVAARRRRSSSNKPNCFWTDAA